MAPGDRVAAGLPGDGPLVPGPAVAAPGPLAAQSLLTRAEGCTVTHDERSLEAEIIGMLMARVPGEITVSPDTRIAGGLGLDSVAILDFIMDLEDRFDVSIPLDRIAEVQTVAELSHAVEALMRAAS